MKRNQKKNPNLEKKESKSKKEKPAKKQKLEESSEPDQQEDNSEPDLVSGSLVWAKIGGFPFWPAMVCPDWRSGPLQSYHRKVASYHQYHVRFFGDASEAWINRSGLKKHPEEQPQTVGTVSKTKKKDFENAQNDIMLSIPVPIEQRYPILFLESDTKRYNDTQKKQKTRFECKETRKTR